MAGPDTRAAVEGREAAGLGVVVAGKAAGQLGRPGLLDLVLRERGPQATNQESSSPRRPFALERITGHPEQAPAGAATCRRIGDPRTGYS